MSQTLASDRVAVPAVDRLTLNGVDHTARPTWKLRETVRFYRDVMGLDLVHTISARGWGTDTHPDFLHFFFDSGNGSTIAFFYYLGTEAPPTLRDRPPMRPVPDDHVFDANHTAWLADSEEELLAWKSFLEDKGVEVSSVTVHETIESIYFRDPNGYFLEITVKTRPLVAVDASDAALTLEAAMQLEGRSHGGPTPGTIDDVWERKARLLEERSGLERGGELVRIFVPDVPEFASLVTVARDRSECEVQELGNGHVLIESAGPVEFGRRELGLKPAVWYGLFTGGLRGDIEVFDRDRVRIGPAA